MTARRWYERNPVIVFAIYQRVIECAVFSFAMALKKCRELCVIPLAGRIAASILVSFTAAWRRSAGGVTLGVKSRGPVAVVTI